MSQFPLCSHLLSKTIIHDQLQVNLELYLRRYPSLYLLPYTAFFSALWVRHGLRAYAIKNEKFIYSVLTSTTIPCIFSASVGLSFLQFTNMNSMRNLIIVGLSLFLGISVPQFFNEYWTTSHHGLVHTNAGWVSIIHALYMSQ